MRNQLKLILHFSFIVILYLITLQNVRATTIEDKAYERGYADIVEKLLPAVVNISTTQAVKPGISNLPDDPIFEEFFELFKRFSIEPVLPPRNEAIEKKILGSGFIVDPSGYIVTNAHVIENGQDIQIMLTDKRNFKATLVGSDQKTDLALLKVESKVPLPYVKFGDSEKARVGDIVIAIGNPFALGGTVTTGIISAKGRDLHTSLVDDFIQTDAAINTGNSGGPMFNLEGEVIGVNTAIYSSFGGNVGIGFAIPSSLAKPIVHQLRTQGTVARGYIGVSIQPMDANIAESLGIESDKSVIVAEVFPNSPASKAGIKVGDIITKFDGKEITSSKTLPRLVTEVGINKTVKVEVIRVNKAITLTLTTEQLPDKAVAASETVEIYKVKIASLNNTLRAKYNIDEKAEGVIITYIDRTSPWVRNGLKEGDVIASINQQRVDNAVEAKKLIEKAKQNNRNYVSFLIIRPKETLFLALPI